MALANSVGVVFPWIRGCIYKASVSTSEATVYPSSKGFTLKMACQAKKHSSFTAVVMVLIIQVSS